LEFLDSSLWQQQQQQRQLTRYGRGTVAVSAAAVAVVARKSFFYLVIMERDKIEGFFMIIFFLRIELTKKNAKILLQLKKSWT